MFPTGVEVDHDLTSVRALLGGVTPAASSAGMLDQIRGLEELRGILAATQASVTASFVTARKAEQKAAGLPARRLGRGLNNELGAARRVSPHRAGLDTGLALTLTTELPATFAALQAGLTSEWRATLVARETGWLSTADRAHVDAQLGPRLHTLGDREVAAEAARLAYTADPHGKVRAMERAAHSRHVALRPLPDGMTRLSAQLPLTQGVAAYAALNAAADTARATGDQRGRGQVMADTLVERITGQTTAEAVPLRVNIIITDQTLVREGAKADAPATVSGHGPIPAPAARDLIANSSRAGMPVELRRMFTDPTGRLISMETRSRHFTPAMAEFVRLRDQHCTTPYCGAPIRHIDHTHPFARGGPTSLANATGTCEACNYATQTPGWTTHTRPDGTHHKTMPTGHTQPAPTQPAPTQPRRPTRRVDHLTAPPGRHELRYEGTHRKQRRPRVTP